MILNISMIRWCILKIFLIGDPQFKEIFWMKNKNRGVKNLVCQDDIKGNCALNSEGGQVRKQRLGTGKLKVSFLCTLKAREQV